MPSPADTLPRSVDWGAPEPNEVRGLLDELVKVLGEAGVMGAEHLMMTPRGWVRPVEICARHLAKHVQETGQPAYIVDLKESQGELTLIADGHREVSDFALWAERQCEGRCMATGRPGTLRSYPWLVTLSDEMAEIYESGEAGRMEVMDLAYPQHRKRAGQ